MEIMKMKLNVKLSRNCLHFNFEKFTFFLNVSAPLTTRLPRGRQGCMPGSPGTFRKASKTFDERGSTSSTQMQLSHSDAAWHNLM